jgi:uncharacterized protein
MITVGIISDTHGFFDPKLREIFRGVAHILHAGDIGQQQIISDLEKIAPVTAVLGNTDGPLPFRETEALELAERRFLLHHIVDPAGASGAIHERIARDQPDVVVFGHTHKPFCQKTGQTLFFNPGYAGRPRFAMPRSVAVIQISGGRLTTRFFPL